MHHLRTLWRIPCTPFVRPQGSASLSLLQTCSRPYSSDADKPPVETPPIPPSPTEELSPTEPIRELPVLQILRTHVSRARRPTPTPPSSESNSSEQDRAASSYRSIIGGSVGLHQRVPASTSSLANSAAVLKQTFAGPIAVEKFSGAYTLNILTHKNNAITSLCGPDGKIAITMSCGRAGYKGAQRKEYEAAYQSGVKLAQLARRKKIPVKTLKVIFRGFGPGRDAVLKGVRSMVGWQIIRVEDDTGIPHGGCRPPKPRRV